MLSVDSLWDLSAGIGNWTSVAFRARFAIDSSEARQYNKLKFADWNLLGIPPSIPTPFGKLLFISAQFPRNSVGGLDVRCGGLVSIGPQVTRVQSGLWVVYVLICPRIDVVHEDVHHAQSAKKPKIE